MTNLEFTILLIKLQSHVDPSLSDYSLVTFDVENFLNIRNNKRNIPSKKIYNYDQMTDDKWETFSNKVDALANGCYLQSLTNKSSFNQNELNRYWNLLQGCILKAADYIRR
ncbi:16452_t:CDS:2 [Funneliformis geosporum]|uniref:16452_t:CDS:1 n=1 Tax=Funneliformis geosporum TaxID=1117311 RepID=A0A9W4SLV9_9GLOM|nr:16452_t:CDS:2 [Funneliformis geosporum]